jgi:hypothetical protein
MTTITINSNSVGTVISRNGSITGLRYVQARNKGHAPYLDRLFGLADTANAGNGTGRTLYQIDVDAPNIISITPDSCWSSQLIADANIRFTES